MKPRARKPVPDRENRETTAELRTRARQIGKLLHLAFDDVVREPVPSEFLDILGQLQNERPQRKPNLH